MSFEICLLMPLELSLICYIEFLASYNPLIIAFNWISLHLFSNWVDTSNKKYNRKLTIYNYIKSIYYFACDSWYFLIIDLQAQWVLFYLPEILFMTLILFNGNKDLKTNIWKDRTITRIWSRMNLFYFRNMNTTK